LQARLHGQEIQGPWQGDSSVCLSTDAYDCCPFVVSFWIASLSVTHIMHTRFPMQTTLRSSRKKLPYLNNINYLVLRTTNTNFIAPVGYVTILSSTACLK
jgi:hypothetical protein